MFLLVSMLALPGCATQYVDSRYENGPPDRATALRITQATLAYRLGESLYICVDTVLPDEPGGTGERVLHIWTGVFALDRAETVPVFAGPPPDVMAGEREIPLYLLSAVGISENLYDQCQVHPEGRELPIVVLEPAAADSPPGEDRFLQDLADRIQRSEHEAALYVAADAAGRLRLFYKAREPIVAGSRTLEIEPFMQRNKGSVGWRVAKPFTILFDIVTAPIQVPVLIWRLSKVH